MRQFLLTCLLATSLGAYGEPPAAGAAASDRRPPPPATVPEPPPMPPLPPEAQDDAPAPETGLEPEVIIVPRGTEIHEEYRINGRLYLIKVIPAKGPPYYLIDEEGNGKFRRSDFEPRVKIPQWVLKRW